MTRRAVAGAEIFDGRDLHSGFAILLQDDLFRGIVTETDVPSDFVTEHCDGGTILPGFVDLQVNGGGGVMFNDATSVEGLVAIAEAHATTGTRALLPTLITDTPERTRAAVDAVETAIANGVAGIVGLHLEGPHLSIARKGAHDPDLIRPMLPEDEAFLCDAAQRLPNLMVTLAPENVGNDQISRLSRAGIIVSLGHTDCSFDQAQSAFSAGARCVTHLFNAMSQLGNREPGLVGAALANGAVSSGLIADGIHVHVESMRAAMRAKTGPGGLFLVTDAMSTVGSDITEFTLNGRRVLRRDGRLTLADGTLAGADLDFPTALHILVEKAGLPRPVAYSMATDGPASVLSNRMGTGRFLQNTPAAAIRLDRSGHLVEAL